jgi:glycosyltransferase involved in cell wall biosynthesis
MPKISVIIPVYNTEKYLPQCLDSVINQGLKDIEIICVDDGSKDNSGKILDEYALKDKRCKVVHKQNEGAGAARNTGLEYATGEFVLFFDSDDYILDGALEKMYTHAQAKDADITICRSLKCLEEEKQLSPILYSVDTRKLKGKTDFSPKDISDEIYQFCVGWPWDKLYKLSFIKENKLAFQNLRHSNDTFFVLFSLSLAEKISILEEALVVHRTHSSSLAATRSKAPDCFYFALLKLREGLKDRNLYNCFEKSFINYCITFSLWHFETINDNKAQKVVFAKIIELLQLIDFEKYPRDYFYSKKGYDVFKKLWKLKNYHRYKLKEYLNTVLPKMHLQNQQRLQSIFSVKNSFDKSHKIIKIFGTKISIRRHHA